MITWLHYEMTVTDGKWSYPLEKRIAVSTNMTHRQMVDYANRQATIEHQRWLVDHPDSKLLRVSGLWFHDPVVGLIRRPL